MDLPPSAADRPVSLPRAAELDLAWEVVRSRLTATPLVPARFKTPQTSWLKLETFQPTGSFKVRGALAAVAALPPGVRAVTASAGNHGLGMVHAAAATSTAVTVVVPATASPTKVAALRAYPIDLVQYGSDYDEAEQHALSLATAGHARFVSAYNDTMVIAGQATIGRELETQLAPGELTIVTPVGGGGLAAGLALWARRRSGVHLVGVEAAASPAVSAAVRAGRVVPITVTNTLADGLAGNLEAGSVTPSVLSDADFVTVDESELAEAMRWLFAQHGLVAEGSGAAAVAAVLAGKVRTSGHVVVLVTGRNVTPAQYADVLALGVSDQAASPR